MRCRPPRPSLLPFVRMLWAGESPAAPREQVLPTGSAHLAFRLSDHPLRLIEDGAARVVGYAVVGGPRHRYHQREVAAGTRSVGAQLHPGAITLLTGLPAHELANRHLALEDLWGRAAAAARQRLLDAADPMTVLEDLLAERLPRVRGLHPAIAHALGRFAATDDVGLVVDECGYSHRRFLSLFLEGVGLGPRQYCRVLRLSRAVALAGTDLPLSQVALDAGFGDQPHLNRDFRALAGLSPGRYRRIHPLRPNHVPLE